jgi:hypothetical protein
VSLGIIAVPVYQQSRRNRRRRRHGHSPPKENLSKGCWKISKDHLFKIRNFGRSIFAFHHADPRVAATPDEMSQPN